MPMIVHFQQDSAEISWRSAGSINPAADLTDRQSNSAKISWGWSDQPKPKQNETHDHVAWTALAILVPW